MKKMIPTLAVFFEGSPKGDFHVLCQPLEEGGAIAEIAEKSKEMLLAEC